MSSDGINGLSRRELERVAPDMDRLRAQLMREIEEALSLQAQQPTKGRRLPKESPETRRRKESVPFPGPLQRTGELLRSFRVVRQDGGDIVVLGIFRMFLLTKKWRIMMPKLLKKVIKKALKEGLNARFGD